MKIAKSNAVNVNGGRFGANVRTRIDGTTKPHWGTDLYAEVNTPVYSIDDGVVVRIVNDHSPGQSNGPNDFGNFVEIETHLPNGNIKRILYAHLNSTNLVVGDSISSQTQIGLSGRTGNAKNVPNPHVHVQVKMNGIKVNPELFLEAEFDDLGSSINLPCN
ncbi:M23 family metallopeptidase [Pedobacter aquae]|uniref:M23 family metallopeptidase n=1 Tax=Pedobacter aquae TaxID=2605747 RepID=A0A5C0VIB1_9SPHI|nr:M23 family metallopeptidase [Pedobacter aquae]QEK52458.1 M23 family metallopeptidase [Pedobacter aquae]